MKKWVTFLMLLAAVSIPLAVLGSYLIARSITQPLSELTRGALRMQGGDYSAPIAAQSRDELMKVLLFTVKIAGPKLGTMDRFQLWRQNLDRTESQQIRGARHKKWNHVAAGPLQHVTHYLGDQHPANSTGHPSDSHNGADRLGGEHI